MYKRGLVIFTSPRILHTIMNEVRTAPGRFVHIAQGALSKIFIFVYFI